MRPIAIDIETENIAASIEPSAELLDRALVGWERFLDTFEGALDE
ncbi:MULTISPECIES: hypothetical protein [unclassified Streptomyces]|nr:hypothetical protein [Streptomyces sp. DK15]